MFSFVWRNSKNCVPTGKDCENQNVWLDSSFNTQKEAYEALEQFLAEVQFFEDTLTLKVVASAGEY